LKYNSGEAISARITNDVLDNEELNNKKDIKETFEVLKTFSPEEKEALFKAVK
jgi:4'-phosphopantetheinyl transferase EntD